MRDFYFALRHACYTNMTKAQKTYINQLARIANAYLKMKSGGRVDSSIAITPLCAALQ